jgi:hypothetical protein
MHSPIGANSRVLIRQILIVLAIIACLIPWVVTPGTSLTLNTYDLAEWASLTPMAHNTTPILLTPLLLRLPLSLTALLVVLSFKNHKLVQLLVVVITSIALMPPFEFVTRASDDPNYRQQFALAILTFLAGIAVMRLTNNHVKQWMGITLAVAAILAGGWGLSQAYAFMQQYNLPVNLGLGAFVFVIALAVMITVDWVSQTKTR